MADSCTTSSTKNSCGSSKSRSKLINGSVFVGIVVVWIIIDRLTKLYFDHSYMLGQASEYTFGLFQFKLVHNTGAAWGMFDHSTFMLGIMSLFVCAVILLLIAFFEHVFEHPITIFEIASLGLIFAGGLGNAIDRFMYGYVVDFIDLTFMNFPVFNIADIGVTCGFVLFMIAVIWFARSIRKGAVEREEEAHE